jgi:molybdate transport system substrate-binding protein
LTVSAAASLRDAFTEVGRAFEASKPGTKVIFNFAASGPLLQQIAQGAPVDAFASADQETLDRAAAQGLIAKETRVTFASNALVLVVPAGIVASPRSLKDLTTDGYRRIAVGNPATVPAGRYAREATDAAGVSDALKGKFIFGESVRQVLTYVGRAEVDAGIVYRSDAMTDKARVRIALEVPTKTPVSYPIVQVLASKQTGLARAFIAFVSTPPAQSILASYGFRKP